ncbi:uncharacterized protein LOC127726278 [Mytilus californianus]|uniref:uncharacterized protein LOC127726278 n=1 Tax=Mytilus californianus TaxID=6549 RepID=UPI0022467BE6|nr:uncharacterized protein LOC127726278 [Mytilus californianus]
MERVISPINCIEHPKLLLSYYCSSHDTVFCDNCKTEIHGSCAEVHTVKNASKSISDGDIVKALVSRITEAKESLSGTTDKLEDNIATLSRQYDRIKQNIFTARQSINEYFDSLEAELTNVVHERCIKGVEEKIVELERRNYTLDQWEDDLQLAMRNDDEEMLFTVVKILSKLHNDMDSYLNDIFKEIKIKHVRWTPIRTDKASIVSFVGKVSLSEMSSTIQRPSSGKFTKALTRESSRVSPRSIGAVNITQESKTEQGLEKVSIKTKQGWDEISSKVKDEEVEITGVNAGLNRASTKNDMKSTETSTVIDLEDGSLKGTNVSNDTNNRTEIKVDEKICQENDSEQNQHIGNSLNQEKGDTVPDGGRKMTSTRGSSRCKPEPTIYSAKSKFEATNLGRKSSTEMQRGLFLRNDGMLFMDKTNKHIFICNKEGQMLHKISLNYEPLDVTMLDEGRAVATIGDNGIQIVNIHSLRKEKAHDVGGFCGGITSYKGQIIVSVDKKLRLLDALGYTLRRLQHDGSASFVCSDNAGKIYYTDSMDHAVHCIAWFGIPVFTYSNKGLKCPMGIVVDSDWFVYVAGFESCNVQKLWPNGRYHSDFLTEKDELHEPSSLAYNENEHEILVISDNNQTVELYDLNDGIRHQQ